MSEKGANIDLLFRNGLKDYEVLPPPGVWDRIKSSGKVKSRPFILYRIAAVVAILLAVGTLTYRLSSQMTINPNDSIAFNLEAASPVYDNPVINQKSLSVDQINPVFNSASTVIDTNIQLPVNIPDSPEQISNYRENTSITLSSDKAIKGSFLSPLKSLDHKTADIHYGDLQYMPQNLVKPANRWSIGAMASPTYYSRFNSGSDQLSSQLMESEQPVISYSGGVAFSYKISKRFSIQSGLYYSSLGQKVDGVNSFSGFKPYDNSKGSSNFEVLTTTGTVQINNPDVFLNANGPDRIVTAYTKDVFDPNKANLQYINNSLTQNFSYLELPVVLKYKVIDKTIGVNVIGGLSYNLLVHNSVYTTVDGNKYTIGDTKGLNPLSLSSSLGMGMEYNFSEKLSLNLEPTFRYYFNPFSVTGSFIHPYSFGIFSGVLYKF
jgi:hypothetical protein